jgi:rRNA-processing protein FCF1
MRQIILDTSFILACVRQNIDFFEKISEEGMEIIIPKQAISELKGLGANIALKIIEMNDFTMANAPGKDADEAILKLAKKNPDAIVATLDRGLQRKFRNRKMIIRGMKKLEII